MRRQHGFRTKGLMGLALLLILIGLTSRAPWPHVRLMLPPLASGATATQQTVPQPGIDGIPASVEQLTVAFDGWGGDVVPDDAARFALLRGRQVDMAVNIPYAIAKNLPRSESTRRGVNPNKGPIWTQTHLANGKMQITFDAEFIIKEKSPGWEALQGDPTLNPKVREGLELAIDKRAIVENFHYGFTSLNQSIYSMGSFGCRKEQGEKISPYDPKRAKALLTEAGYPNGFSTAIHFGVFTGRPGQPEALEAIASYWKNVGVDLKIVQHNPTEFYTRLNRPDRAYRPMTLVTWGRQEAGEYIAEQAASSGGGRAVYNDRTNALAKELTRTLDEAARLRLMAEIEDEVLCHHWVIPLYDASAVFGWTMRGCYGAKCSSWQRRTLCIWRSSPGAVAGGLSDDTSSLI